MKDIWKRKGSSSSLNDHPIPQAVVDSSDGFVVATDIEKCSNDLASAVLCHQVGRDWHAGCENEVGGGNREQVCSVEAFGSCRGCSNQKTVFHVHMAPGAS